jgi:hypothetical protein
MIETSLEPTPSIAKWKLWGIVEEHGGKRQEMTYQMMEMSV